MNRRNFIKTVGAGIITSTIPSFASEEEEILSNFLGEDYEVPKKFKKIEIAEIKREIAIPEKERLEFPIFNKQAKRNINMSLEHFYLDLVNVHTGEKLSLNLANPSREHLLSELKKFAYFMRDYRTGTVKNVDPGLLTILKHIKQQTGTKKPFLVLSGYRTKKTNDMLRRKGHKAALHSLHMQAKAIDITLQDTSVRKIGNIARGLKMGGVGEYKSSHFVHIDTGRVRQWYG